MLCDIFNAVGLAMVLSTADSSYALFLVYRMWCFFFFFNIYSPPFLSSICYLLFVLSCFLFSLLLSVFGCLLLLLFEKTFQSSSESNRVARVTRDFGVSRSL